MNILERITLAIRAAAGGLMSDDRPSTPQDTQRLLSSAQRRVERLNKQLAQADEREKAAEQEWRDARALAEALETEVDAAVRGGQDAEARVKLAQLNQAQIYVQQLDSRWRRAATATEKLRIEINDLQAQLEVIRRRLGLGASTSTVASTGSATETSSATAVGTVASISSATETGSPAETGEGSAPAAGSAPLDETRISDLLRKRD